MDKSFNSRIIDNLTTLYEYELLNNNNFKASAYKKVITNIKESDLNINNIEDVKKINGVGKSILEKINEIFETGKLEVVDDILKDPKYILSKKLLDIYGIGPSKIKELLEKINSFDELYLEKNKDLLNDKQKICLKYYDDLLLRIPYIEAKKHHTIIKKNLLKINKDLEFELVGSYRRKNKTVGDIDVLIKYNPDFKLKDFIDNLISSGYILDTLAIGKNKFMGVCKLDNLPARRIDILISNEDNYYFALLYFTGSYNFNIYMRNIALQKGYSLSEYGFKDNKTKKLIDTNNIIKSEKDIFDYLKMEYVSPEKRL